MEHLSLEIFDLTGSGSKYAAIEPDTSITITDTSEIFASGDVWSYSFVLNVRANAHIFGTTGDMHGGRLHEQIDHRRARLWVEGLPLFLGYLKLDGTAEVDSDGNVDVSFESGQKTFNEMIEGAKANQVPMIGDVPFGVALWRKRKIRETIGFWTQLTFDTGEQTGPLENYHNVTFVTDGEDDNCSVQEYPRMVFPKGTFKNVSTNTEEPVDYLNTDIPYTENENGTPTHPYCNVALCYQRYGYEKTDQNGNPINDYTSDAEAQRGYEYMPANRVNSAPNFFVLYWLRCLMKHLGINIEENQMMDVEDLRRLFFVNTKCAYRQPKRVRGEDYDRGYKRYVFADYRRYLAEHFGNTIRVDAKGSKLNWKNIRIGEPQHDVPQMYWHLIPTATAASYWSFQAEQWSQEARVYYESQNNYLHDAYATSECFPDADISEVISAIENGFGVRFLFSDNYQRVRIVLLRNVFRNGDVQDVRCDIMEESKSENNIRGFRMTYGNTDDTQFYYKGFNDKLPHKKEMWQDDSDTHDYSHWSLNEEYGDIINKVSAFDKTCFVTPVNGNAYGIKVDKDARRYEDLHPSLFEYAGFMDAEDGDCTGEDETIEEISMGFSPAIMNDINMAEERATGTHEQRFALFVDKTMEPRRPDLCDGTNYNDSDAVYDVDGRLYAHVGGTFIYQGMMVNGFVKPGIFNIASDMSINKTDIVLNMTYNLVTPTGNYLITWPVTVDIDGYLNEGYCLYLQDNYKPNDDGVAPVEEQEWGLTLGIMRGSGSDAGVRYSDDPQDMEGNDTWDIVPGSNSTVHPDTCDSYGEEWIYNGQTVVTTAAQAIECLSALFPDSNAPFNNADGYIFSASLQYITDNEGRQHNVLFAFQRCKVAMVTDLVTSEELHEYVASLQDLPAADIMAADAARRGLAIELDSSSERRATMLRLCKKAYANLQGDIVINNGVASKYGRVSLKLRAEKPNPYFDPTQPETHYDPEHPEADTNPRYLHIDSDDLQRRGLCDQFYSEYSYWVRNARIAQKKVRMDLAQLLAIDKTKKVRVGDVTGFVRKMQYSVSNKTGLGEVTMEIMYI